MGTVVDTQVDGENDNGESDFGNISASDPVVYQLVRVEGDGRLVPATDDEVMEVEHLLEEDKSGLASDEATKHFDGCVSNERLPSKNSDFDAQSLVAKLGAVAGAPGSDFSKYVKLDPEKREEKISY